MVEVIITIILMLITGMACGIMGLMLALNNAFKEDFNMNLFKQLGQLPKGYDFKPMINEWLIKKHPDLFEIGSYCFTFVKYSLWLIAILLLPLLIHLFHSLT